MKTIAFLIALLSSGFAHAARYAVVIGNNVGRGLDVPLRYAESDARRLAAVLRELGGFDPRLLRVLTSPNVAARHIGAMFARRGPADRAGQHQLEQPLLQRADTHVV